MRSEGNDAVVDCDDPMTVIACTTDTDACPAACKEAAGDDTDVVVKSGDLAVTATPATDRKVIIPGEPTTEGEGENAVVVHQDPTVSDTDTLRFKTSEEVTINRVILERYGYSSNSNVDAVRLENEGGEIISNEAGLNTKGQAKLSIKKEYRNVDGTMNATIVVRMNDTANAGSTIGFKVVDVESTAKNLNVDDYKPYTYDMVVYGGVDTTISAKGTEKSYNFEAEELYEVAKFKVKAPADSAILVNGFTMTNKGTLDVDKYLEDLEVTVAGETVKVSKAEINKEDELVVSFQKAVRIAAKENIEFAVKASFSDEFDAYKSTIQYYINGTNSFNAVDEKTESRVKVSGATYDPDNNPWPLYTFDGGKARITSTKLGNVDVAINASDVVIAEGKIDIDEAIKVAAGNLTISATINTTNAEVENGTVPGIIEALRLSIAGDEYDGTWDADEGYYTFPAIEIEDAGKIQVLVDTFDRAAYEKSSLTFSMDGWDMFYYSAGKASNETDYVDIAGSLNFSKVTIQGAKSSLTNTLNDGVEYKNNEVNRYTVFDGKYTAKKSDVELNSFTVDLPAASELTDLGNSRVTFYLVIDGDEVSYVKLRGDSLTASDSFNDVRVKAGETVSVKVEAEVDARVATVDEDGEAIEDALPEDLGAFKITLDGVDANGNDLDSVSKNTVELTIVGKGTPSVSSDAAKNTVLLRAANQVIAEFTVKPSGASEIDLENIEFKLTPAMDSDSVSLYVDGVDEEVSCNDAGLCTADLTNKVKESGISVKVELTEKVLATEAGNALSTMVLNGLKINDESFTNRTFSKAFADAVITFTQEDKGDYTLFKVQTLKKEKNSTAVSNLYFNGHNGSDEDVDEDGNPIVIWGIPGDVSEGDTFEVSNGTKTVSISQINYTTTDGGVEVTRTVYPDYFKTAGGADLRVYSNSK